MGRQTDLDPTNRYACCAMEGVRCRGSDVVEIGWQNQTLKGSIPPEVGILQNLQRL